MEQVKLPHKLGQSSDELDRLEERLTEKAKALGEHHGKQGLPYTETEFRTIAVNEIVVTMQHEININRDRYQPSSAKAEAAIISQEADEEARHLKAKLFTVTLREKEEAQHLNTFNVPKHARLYRISVYVMLGLFGFAEAFVLYPALRNIMSLPSAIAGAFIIFGLVTFVGHLCALLIKRSKTKLLYVCRFSILLLIAAGVFYGLAYLRVTDYSSSYDLAGTEELSAAVNFLPAWCLALISFTGFLGCILLSIHITPSKEERATENAYKRALEKLVRTREEMAVLEKKIDALKKNTTSRVLTRFSTFETGATNECRLVSLAPKLLEAYKQANLLFRSTIPDFYANPVQFSFQTYFTNTQKD